MNILKKTLEGAVGRVLGIIDDDQEAAVVLGIDADDVKNWRARLSLGPVDIEAEKSEGALEIDATIGGTGIEVSDIDGDGDLDVTAVWNGRRFVVFRGGE